MNPIFTNTTKYSKSIYKIFLEFHSKTFILPFLLNTLPVIGIILFIIFLHFSNYILPSAIFLSIFLLIYVLYKFLKPIKEVKKDFKSSIIKEEDSFKFEFYDKYFTISNCKTTHKKDKFFYCNLFKIFETNSFFYLYIDDSHSFILDKSNFSINTTEITKFFNTKKKVTHKNF